MRKLIRFIHGDDQAKPTVFEVALPNGRLPQYVRNAFREERGRKLALMWKTLAGEDGGIDYDVDTFVDAITDLLHALAFMGENAQDAATAAVRHVQWERDPNHAEDVT